MAYDRDKVYQQAIEIAKEPDVYFISDIIASLAITRPTFYDYFPENSDKLNNLKTILEQNRKVTKQKLRKRWNSDESAPVLQIALYKLIADEDEGDRINSQRTKVTIDEIHLKSIEKAFDGVEDEDV